MLSAGNAQSEINHMPELGRLKAAAERVAFATQRIRGFIERFGGPRGTEAGSTAPCPPPTYRNDINGLFDQIEALENVASALDEIG